MEINSDDFTLVDFCKSPEPDILDRTKPFMAFIEDMHKKGTYTYRRAILSACGAWATVREERTDRQQMVMLASNNYLGLNTRPEVIRAAQEAIEKYGTSMCGAPLLNGTSDLLLDLERRLAEFAQCEDAMVFPTGYSANVGVISALLRPNDMVFIDRLSHASIVDGCHLAGCTIHAFPHESMSRLERMLARAKREDVGKLVVVDGVYSMDGNIANLPEIVRLARQYGARVMVDEAHAVGVLGKRGAGTVEHFGLQGQVDIVMGTFSKSLASTGGFIAASREVVNYVRHYARSYFFSASPTPCTVATVLAALDIIQKEPELRERLWENVRYFHSGLKVRGLDVRPDPPQSAVLAVIITPSRSLRAVSRAIHEQGVYLNSVEYPAVPKKEPRLRIGIMATHTRDDLDFALDVLSWCVKAVADAGHAAPSISRHRPGVNALLAVSGGK